MGNELPVFRKSIYLLLLGMAVSTVYGYFLQNPIVFDDLEFFMQPLDSHLGFHLFHVRWLPYFTIAWTADVIGLNVMWLRLEGVFLHAATGIAIFIFLQRLFELTLKEQGRDSVGLPPIWTAFFGALIFVWHPVAVYGAAYLIERTIVMATLFSVLALYAYMRGVAENSPRWLWGSVLLYGFAVFSKEHAVMLPAVMLALTLLLGKVSGALCKRIWPIYATCALIALFVIMQKLGLLGAVYEVEAPEMLGHLQAAKHPYPLSVLTQSFLFFKYWLLWLVPNPAWMSVDMREPFASSFFSKYLLAALAFVGYGAVAFKLLLKRGEVGLLGFGLIFPWLLFATEFSTVRIQESFVLYRSYLWMAGIFPMLPFLLKYVRAQWAFVGLSACALILAMLAVDRLTTFSNPFLLWDDAAVLVGDKRNLPGVSRIYYNRGKSLTDLGRFPEALADYQRAVSLAPNDVANRYALGVGYMNVARYADAIVEFGKAIEINPKHVQARLGRGLSYLELGNKTAALADLEGSCMQGFKIACAKIQSLEREPPSN